MTNWAVIVGINQYEHLSPQEHLKFAVSDAERVKQFLCNQAGFPEDFVILCSDTSKPVSGLNTRPDSVSLRKILRTLSEHPNAQNAEQAWFFFSGHGLLGKDNQNYLLTSNSDPEDLEHSAISVEFVIQQLIRCKAKNMVLVLDMCRNEAPSGSKGSSGFNEAKLVQQAQQNGIITIFSCSRGGKSYELADLQQGAFTHAFLEGLQQHTILRQLDDYLRDKVYALTQTKQPAQIPLIVPEPGWKYDRPLLTHCATKADIETLKSQAIHAWIIEKNLDLAEQLWELINDLATDSQDRKLSRESLLKIIQERQGTGTIISPHLQNSVGTGLAISLPTNPPSSAKTAPANPQDLGKGRLAGEKYGLDLAANARETKKTIEDDLSSEKGIGYIKLRNLLKAQKWKEADRETYLRMLQAVGRKEGDWIRAEELKTFPCIDLKTIDDLWVKYSDGHFGFSVQKKIWQECDSPTQAGKDWDRFCVKAGWKISAGYVSYSALKFNLKISPKGELPWEVLVGVGSVFWFRCLCLFSLAETCKV